MLQYPANITTPPRGVLFFSRLTTAKPVVKITFLRKKAEKKEKSNFMPIEIKSLVLSLWLIAFCLGTMIFLSIYNPKPPIKK